MNYKKIAQRVAKRFLKSAGWWAISPGNSGINPPPVDKGGLLNAIPGIDPADAAMYNGDGPADIMDAALRDIGTEYRRAWGRDAKPEEIQAVWDFCTHRIFDGDLSKIEKQASMAIRVASAHMNKEAIPVNRGQEKFRQIMRMLELDPEDPSALRELQHHKRMLTPGFVLTRKDWQSLTGIIGTRQAQELWKGYTGTVTKYTEWPAPVYQDQLESELTGYAEVEIKERWDAYAETRFVSTWGTMHPHDPRYPEIDEDMDVRVGLWGIAGEDAGVEILEEGEIFDPPRGSFHIERPVTLNGTNAGETAGWLIGEYEAAFRQQVGREIAFDETKEIENVKAYSLETTFQRISGVDLDWSEIRPVGKTQIQILTKPTKIHHIETVWSILLDRNDGEPFHRPETTYLKQFLSVR